MPRVSTRAAGLVLIDTGFNDPFRIVGGIPGAYVIKASGLSGPGIGRLKSEGPLGQLISWKAPGSSNFGVPVLCDADDSYLLEDGDDSDKWVTLAIVASFLEPHPSESPLHLTDAFNTSVASDDVSAAEASAGDVHTYGVSMLNVSGVTLTRIRFWLDAAVADLEISEDDVVFVSPTTEATGLAFPNISRSGVDTLFFKRTIVHFISYAF